MYESYRQCLSTLQSTNKYRRLGRLRQYNSNGFLDFSTNDYLALSQNPQLIDASIMAVQEYGVGSTGSRLLSGNIRLYEELEERIAKDKNTEASLIFNSGFQANISALASLLDEKVLNTRPIVLFDKLNHSSLYQAIHLSKAELLRYSQTPIKRL